MYNQPICQQVYDRFRRAGCKQSANITPEWAAPITEIPAETIRRIAREFAAAAPYALAHNGWRTSNFINSFQTERAIAILNALVGNWGTAMFPAGGEESGALGAPPQPPYPRVSALRLDGVPWKYPFVPLKIGVFQELRDAIAERDTLPGARLVHLPPEPGHVPAGPQARPWKPSARWISSPRWTSS